MRIMVLGGLGYVGSVFLGKIEGKSHDYEEVAVIDAGWFGKPELSSKIELQYPMDIRHVTSEDFLAADVVVNLAAVSNDAMGKEFDVATWSVNTQAAVRTANLAREAGVKAYVYASSASVYGSSPGGIVTEFSETNPLSIYGRSKLAAENELRSLAGRNFRVVCLRFATACGPSKNMRSDLALNDFVASAVQKNFVELKSSGEASRPFISTDDMGSAITSVINQYEDLEDYFSILNVGNPDWNFTVRHLASTVASYFDCPIRVPDGASRDNRDYRLSFDKWLNFAGHWKPEKSIDKLIQDMGEIYRKLLESDEDPYGGERIRLDYLRKLISLQILEHDSLFHTKEAQSV